MQSPAPTALNPKPALPFHSADKCIFVKSYLCFRDKDGERKCSKGRSNYSYCRSSGFSSSRSSTSSSQKPHICLQTCAASPHCSHPSGGQPSQVFPQCSSFIHTGSLLELQKFKTLVRQNTPISSGGKTQTLTDIFSCPLRESPVKNEAVVGWKPALVLIIVHTRCAFRMS